MKKTIIIIAYFLGCSSLIFSQTDSTRMFIFGHSLIDHRPPLIPTPSNETTVPHWLYLLSQEAGKYYGVDGQYGFLPQHSNLPPIAQWGYDLVPGVWDSDNEPFSEADITTVLITAGNFMQWQGPDLDYPSDPGISPISATEDIVDWVQQEEENAQIYIYENWPDMASFLSNGFPPNDIEFENYGNYVKGDFHDWWIDYQDALLESKPNAHIRMIPVGPLISDILTEGLTAPIAYTELYEDDAPHGRATTYFLAGLITYMGIHQEQAPSSFIVPSIVHPEIASNYQAIVQYIWTELNAFNTQGGESRVFFETNAVSTLLYENNLKIVPNPVSNSFEIVGDISNYNIDLIDIMGRIQVNKITNKNVSIDHLTKGIYSLRIHDTDTGMITFRKIIKL